MKNSVSKDHDRLQGNINKVAIITIILMVIIGSYITVPKKYSPDRAAYNGALSAKGILLDKKMVQGSRYMVFRMLDRVYVANNAGKLWNNASIGDSVHVYYKVRGNGLETINIVTVD